MSNTIRTVTRLRRLEGQGRFRNYEFHGHETIKCDESKARNSMSFIRQKKMKPFATKVGKFQAETIAEGSNKITRQEKLITKNANRSLKKGVRQEYKKKLKKELNKLGY